jgi:nitrilase
VLPENSFFFTLNLKYISMPNHLLKVALAQISPVWLDKEKTLQKVALSIEEAASKGCELIIFGEGLIPGYPWWLSITHASDWDNKIQKEIHAHYL